MEKRLYGKTGIKLSIVGFGGIAVRDEKPSSASHIVAEAIKRGINYFDVAPSYGNAEEILGPALEPYRKSIFLACKTEKRCKDEAMKDLYRSLEHLKTDYFDLYQLHAVTTLKDVDQILGEGGAIEAFVEAREHGLVKYLGFSAHSEEAAIALMNHFNFNSVLFPLNWVCWHQSHFGPHVIEKAQEKGLAILALKALAKRKWKEGEREHRWSKCWYAPVESQKEASLALRFTLSLPITATVGPSHAELLWWACDVAEQFKPLSREEITLVSKKSEGLDPIFPN